MGFIFVEDIGENSDNVPHGWGRGTNGNVMLSLVCVIGFCIFLIFNFTLLSFDPYWTPRVHLYLGIISFIGFQISLFVYFKFKRDRSRIIKILNAKPEDVNMLIFKISEENGYQAQRYDFLDGDLFYWKNTELVEVKKGIVYFQIEMTKSNASTVEIIIERINDDNEAVIYMFAREINDAFDDD